MAFYRCGGGGDGERLTETVLWTNPSPTANFSATSITLSDNVENYDFIKITWCAGKGSTSQVVDCLLDIPWSNPSQAHVVMMGRNSSEASFTTRTINSASGNTITIGSASGNSDAGSCIPLKVYGVKVQNAVIPRIEIDALYAGSASANVRTSASYVFRDVSKYNTLRFGSVTKDSGTYTIAKFWIMNHVGTNESPIYTFNFSDTEQTFDISTFNEMQIAFEFSATATWKYASINDIVLE